MTFEISYYKPKNRNFLETLENVVDNLQNYMPIYKLFFDLTESNYNKILLNQKYHIKNASQIKMAPREEHDLPEQTIIADCYLYATLSTADGEDKKEKIIFIKYSPVLDPIKYIIGKYDVFDERIRNLPQLNSTEDDCLSKMLDTNNSSYIDGFFTYLTSQLLHNHNFIHGVDYYGSYMGIQKNYKMNVMDDLEYLQNSKFFRQNMGKLFNIENIDIDKLNSGGASADGENMQKFDNSRNCRIRLDVGQDIELELDELEDTVCVGEAKENMEVEPESIYEKPDTQSCASDSDDDSSLNYTSDENSEIMVTDLSGEDENAAADDGDSDDDESTELLSSFSDDTDEEVIIANIYNFPVHMILLEKCEGTLDNLMEYGAISDEEWRSALIQVIMTLIVFQKTFYLTHNDLHTNNIMFIQTKHKYIYYKIEGQYFCVPTYGKIFKIIDFGRAIYTYRGRLFCSDSFEFHGDAAGQYNFYPFYDDKKPIIEPNYSFDLCRLGCSMYDFFVDDDDIYENLSPLKKLIYEWCCDDNGKNILYKKSGEERYPDFKLYKMIARTAHKHTPLSQLSRPFFRKYLCEGVKMEKINKCLFVDIDSIPCYVN